jgi:uncharacterized protein
MEGNIEPIVFYHKDDFDGICSAAIFEDKFGGHVELYGLSHGGEFPWDRVSFVGFPEEELPKREVYMVDFSLSLKHMTRLSKIADLTWIDHHATAIDSMKDLELKGIRRTDRAACELTWEYLYPDKEIPKGVEYLGVYDSWREHGSLRWEQDIVPYQYGLKGVPNINDPKDWMWNVILHSREVGSICRDGRVILPYQKSLCEEIARSRSYEVEFDGHSAVALNTPMKNSMSLESVYNEAKHDLMIVYSYNGEAMIWTVSIYTTKAEIHCGEIAKRFGGGGHNGAAGFESKTLPSFLKQEK